jgi:hypothetical protein
MRMFNIWCLFVVSVETDSKCTGDYLSWLVKLVVILWIRGRNADLSDAHKTEHTARSIQGQIQDDGGFLGSNLFDIAKKLAELIDEYTAL